MLHEIILIGIVQSVTIQVCVQATHLMHVCLIRQQIWLAVVWLMDIIRVSDMCQNSFVIIQDQDLVHAATQQKINT